mgnify:CR=1 FL=1
MGVRGKNAAFVFGAYSTLEKFANGIILYAIMVRGIFIGSLIKKLECERCEFS